MPSRPALSVLIPCHNHGDVVGRAIESALGQDGTEAELILVNDGSTDDSGEALEAWARREPGRIRVIHQANRGQARARQAALERARGDWIIQLDADDRLEPGMMRRCLDLVHRQPGTDVVVADAWRVTEQRGQEVRQPYHQAAIVGWPDILDHNPYGALAATLARRAAVEGVGGLAIEGPSGCEDWDLWIRLTRSGHRFAALAEPLACYFQSPGAWSRRPGVMLQSAVGVLARAGSGDSRIQGRPQAPPVAPDVLDRLVNRQVAHALGMVAGQNATAAQVEEIASFWRPDGLERSRAVEAFIWGLEKTGAARWQTAHAKRHAGMIFAGAAACPDTLASEVNRMIAVIHQSGRWASVIWRLQNQHKIQP